MLSIGIFEGMLNVFFFFQERRKKVPRIKKSRPASPILRLRRKKIQKIARILETIKLPKKAPNQKMTKNLVQIQILMKNLILRKNLSSLKKKMILGILTIHLKWIMKKISQKTPVILKRNRRA